MCEHGYYIYLIYMAVKCAVKNTITYKPAYYKGHQANLTQGNICQTIRNKVNLQQRIKDKIGVIVHRCVRETTLKTAS